MSFIEKLILYFCFGVILGAVITRVFAQENLKAEVFQQEIKISWDLDEGNVYQWHVFYAQAADTTLFQKVANFVEGASFYDVSGYWVSSVLYNKATVWNKSDLVYYGEGEEVYVKIGVVAETYIGEKLPLRTIGPFLATILETPSGTRIEN